MFPAAATDATNQYCQTQHSFAPSGGDHDSAFDGDVDIGIALVFGALQWPEYLGAAQDWVTRMECEVNTVYGDGYNYPSAGDSWNKNCESDTQCGYDPKTANQVDMGYYPPGYFRVFGDFFATCTPLLRVLPPRTASATMTSGTRPPRLCGNWWSSATTRPA